MQSIYMNQITLTKWIHIFLSVHVRHTHKNFHNLSNSNELNYQHSSKQINTSVWWNYRRTDCHMHWLCDCKFCSTYNQQYISRNHGYNIVIYYAQCCWKNGRPVAKCDHESIGPTTDGPFNDQWILQVLQKMFWNESGQTIPQMRWYQISIVP